MQTPGRKGFAVTDGGGHLRLGLTVGLGLALDLATKYLGWHSLGGPPDDGGHTVTVIANWVTLVASRNPGIVFGLNFSDSLGLGAGGARALTVVLTLATVGLIFYVFAVSGASQKWLHIWCGLVMAGALGNLYDRLLFGYVRDLIQITAHVEIGSLKLHWPYVFNVADIYLVVGVAAIAIAFLFTARSAKSLSR
jgi:signal peptidase II